MTNSVNFGKALRRDIAKAEKAKERAELAELKAAIRTAKAARKAAIVQARKACKQARANAKANAARLRAKAKAQKPAARTVCEIGKSKARDKGAIDRAVYELETVRKDRAVLKQIERGNRARTKERAKRSTSAERLAESDDEVRSNLPPELVPLFDRIRKGIKPGLRKSRTEAFLEYVEAHPEEVYEGIDAKTDAMIAEYEARMMRHANPGAEEGFDLFTLDKIFGDTNEAGKRVWSSSVTDYAKPTILRRLHYRGWITYEGDGHYFTMKLTQEGRSALEYNNHRVRNPASYKAMHWGQAGKGMREGLAPDPSKPCTALGELHSVVYITQKGKDRAPTEYEHTFSRPRPVLVFNEDGLLIVGGAYKVETRGIVK